MGNAHGSDSKAMRKSSIHLYERMRHLEQRADVYSVMFAASDGRSTTTCSSLVPLDNPARYVRTTYPFPMPHRTGEKVAVYSHDTIDEPILCFRDDVYYAGDATTPITKAEADERVRAALHRL